MIVLIDTNVILDVLLAREPFIGNSVRILRMAESNQLDCYISANIITDIFYILRKHLNDNKSRENAIKSILAIVDIVSITKRDIYRAFNFGLSDFEDAIQVQCADKIKADYIITRNQKDFKNIVIPVVSPEHFLKLTDSPDI